MTILRVLERLDEAGICVGYDDAREVITVTPWPGAPMRCQFNVWTDGATVWFRFFRYGRRGYNRGWTITNQPVFETFGRGMQSIAWAKGQKARGKETIEGWRGFQRIVTAAWELD